MKSIAATLQKFLCLAGAALALGTATPALATAQLDQDVDAALKSLYDTTPAAKVLGDQAKGVLVFPNIVKAGFIVGAQGGDGVLIKGGKKVANYHSAGVSAGLQAGVQTFGYTLFFMSDKVMKDFEKSKGWEVGIGPNIVIVDSGAAKDITTMTGKADIYAFIFDQKGLMAGIGIKGSKITKIKR